VYYIRDTVYLSSSFFVCCTVMFVCSCVCVCVVMYFIRPERQRVLGTFFATTSSDNEVHKKNRRTTITGWLPPPFSRPIHEIDSALHIQSGRPAARR